MDRTQSIFGDDAADGTRGKASLRDFLIRVDDKISRVNDLAPFFPVGTNFGGISWHFQAVADGKRRFDSFGHLFSFTYGINREGYDVYVLFLELVKVSLVVGQLPNTVGSPDATIENDNRVFALQVLRDAECPAICELNDVVWELITGV